MRFFKVFAATALAGLGHLTPTLRQRSIVISLEEAPPGVLKARFDPRHIEVETVLGRKIARWARDNFDALAACDPVMSPKAHNRLADNWRPLFAVAQIIGGHWPQQVLEAFNHLTAPSSSSSSSFSPSSSLCSSSSSSCSFSSSSSNPEPSVCNLQLLSDLRQIFTQTSAERLFSSAIVDHLRSLPDRPWSGTINGDEPITEARLARRLNIFSIGSRNIRIGDSQAKGYALADLSPAFARFLPPPSP